MQTLFPDSQLVLLDSLSTTLTESELESEPESQKAWHLLSLLLSVGRPIPPQELASRCTVFHATPDLIQSLCSIPNSPITLASNNSCSSTNNNNNNGNSLFVTISLLGLFAFKRFVSNSNLIDAFVTRFDSAVGGPGVPLDLEDAVRMYFRRRKRKRIEFDFGDVDDNDRAVSPLSKRFRNAFTKVHFCITEDISSSIKVKPSFMSLMSVKLNNMILTPDLSIKNFASELTCKLKDIKEIEDEMDTSTIMQREEHKRIIAYDLDEESALPNRILDKQVAVCQEAKVDEIDLKSRTDFHATTCLEDVEHSCVFPVESVSVNDACNATNDCHAEAVGTKCKEEELLTDSGKIKEVENIFGPINTALLDAPCETDCKRMNEFTSPDKEPVTTHVNNRSLFPTTELSVAQKQLPKPKMKTKGGDAMAPRQEAFCQSLEQSKFLNHPKENHKCKKDHVKISMAQKLKQKHDDLCTKEGGTDAASICPRGQVEPKDLPRLDSYIVEEEEGSGGYGTVYRARRKNDGIKVAIKCPHENAQRHHVSNELRMLERLGGKNFVIKYEGRIKKGNSDCFVLEHVEHDRPEVLKKEINIFQLRWYGYCMFRALASLHKQGIVHRDVKPGNFLFSRKASKGYLIDFNLAMDLYQKYGTINKIKAGNNLSFKNVTPSNAKYVAPPTKSRRFPGSKSLDPGNQEATKSLKSTLEPKNLKKKPMDCTRAHNNLGGWNIMKSQGADGSGITSAKDVTSTRTPSAERLREPLPCQGRKELINLLQEAMQSPNHEASSVPASMRKRVAAPPGKVDGRPIYLTPMPLASSRIPVSIKNKGDGKHKKEGPCVGTKGFRAPEVLFRSLHQGPKVDVWSAGVTLLYLIIGRTPFYGDPEQNIKDIAKLRGSEDLWEVSKLHDRESSFPADLYNMQSLPSMTLWEWCKLNTKRQDFLNVIPSSLIDLVDKCLIVNPRLRISAEDALKHEFFAPCHEGLQKQRLLRQGLSLDSGTNLPIQGKSITIPVKASHQQA